MDVSFQEHIDRLTAQLRSELLRHYEKDVAVKARRFRGPKLPFRMLLSCLPSLYCYCMLLFIVAGEALFVSLAVSLRLASNIS